MKSLPVYVLLLCLLASCDTPPSSTFLYETDEEIMNLVINNSPLYPDTSFAVLTDMHYFAPELYSDGKAFQEYLAQDRKMLQEGPEILEAVITGLDEHAADFVIICGDLTKDGELESHRQVAEKLSELEASGKAVFVIPGNHDILNGESNSYSGDIAQRISNVDPEMYLDIYNKYGYAEAIDTDPGSLSYIVEPKAGLWLFAMDSCRYRENIEDGHPVTGGTYYSDTRAWLEEKLIEAIRREKSVIGVMHHGILEHYPANEKHYGDYLLDDFDTISKMFAAYGMRFVFTGHYHAQDITKNEWQTDLPNHWIFDIETGSLVTYPVPWRLVSITDEKMKIESYRVETIDSRPDDFHDYAKQFATEKTIILANETLTEYGVPVPDQEKLSPQIAVALTTHLQGDEQTPETYFDLTGITAVGRLVVAVQGDLIRGWYTDLPPADNSLTIDMTSGEIVSD